MPIIIATALGFLKRIPWWAFAAVAGAAALWWLIADDRHYRTKAAELTTTLSQVKDAQAKATIAAQAAHDAQEQRYKDLANAADTKHVAETASADDAVEQYIAQHRLPVCPASGGSSGDATAAPAHRDPAVPASVPASGFVVISEPDMHACTDATVYAVDAHNHAMGLNP